MGKKLTIDKMNEVAKQRNGECLSTIYINAQTKLIWECNKGHQWGATFHNVQRGTWCPKCAIQKRVERQRLDLNEVKRLAKERGGKCLSMTYTNAHNKFVWECEKGHQWKATPASVIYSKSWCPACFNEKHGRVIPQV